MARARPVLLRLRSSWHERQSLARTSNLHFFWLVCIVYLRGRTGSSRFTPKQRQQCRPPASPATHRPRDIKVRDHRLQNIQCCGVWRDEIGSGRHSSLRFGPGRSRPVDAEILWARLWGSTPCLLSEDLTSFISDVCDQAVVPTGTAGTCARRLILTRRCRWKASGRAVRAGRPGAVRGLQCVLNNF
jgi:hypothetical protein